MTKIIICGKTVLVHHSKVKCLDGLERSINYILIFVFFTDEKFVLDFTSIGTLFAFVLVCGGVLMLPRREKQEGKFNLPYINAKFIFPLLVIIAFVLLLNFNPEFFTNTFIINSETAATNVPMLVFFVVCVLMSVFSFLKNFSLIPVLGLVSCCYLLTGMALSNWIWFTVWLIIGVVIYFLYGLKKSKLATNN